MARNKYPKETRNKILDVSIELFLEKGYEHTSIQDIINKLDGLTKGAIYHHFKSKEDILLSVLEHIYKNTGSYLINLFNRKDLNGLQKLQKMLQISLEEPAQNNFFSIAPNLLKSPQILAIQIEQIADKNGIIYTYIESTWKQGIADGSIQTEYERELFEVILLLCNIWLNPTIFTVTAKEMLRKCLFFKQLLISMGLDLINDKTIQYLEKFANIYEKKNLQK